MGVAFWVIFSGSIIGYDYEEIGQTGRPKGHYTEWADWSSSVYQYLDSAWVDEPIM